MSNNQQLGQLIVGEPGPDNSYVVLQTPDERYRELYNNGGVLANRAFTGDLLVAARTNAATYGSYRDTNCALWARGEGSTGLVLVDAGVYKVFLVSDLGALSTATPITVDPRLVNGAIIGASLEGATRVALKTAAGTPSGLILQSPNGTPWVIWVDQPNNLRCTSWADFRAGLGFITLTNLSPTTWARAGAQTLTATGTNFQAGSVLRMDDTINLTTTFVNATTLTTAFTANYFTQAGSHTIVVRTSGQLDTPLLTFSVT